MSLTLRDKVLQDAAREALAEVSQACGHCGQRFVRVGGERWYRFGDHRPPCGPTRRWCDCGRMLPA